MRVWLLHIGEHLPVDGAARVCRYGYLAQALVDRGHDVLRWAPTFRHTAKSHRFTADRLVPVGPSYAIQFVHSPGYRRNVGIDRLREYRILGRRFREMSTRQPPPDLIVAAIPSLEWADAAVEYGRARGIPVVIDVRDLWPDVFLNALPGVARSAARFALAPYYRLARRACRGATALVAVSQCYLDWALRLAGRPHRSSDQVVPLGFEPDPVEPNTIQQRVGTLYERGLDRGATNCLFAGLLERSYDLETVIDAACRLSAAGGNQLQFILCGDGSKAAALARRADGLRNVHLLGWVDAAMLQAAASISAIGLCAYANDALQSLPNKPFEYMAGRLAIASSLTGEMAALIEGHQCGVTYRAGDRESCAAALSRLAADVTRLDAMRSNAYEVWSRQYRSSHIYGRFVEHLEGMACASRAA